MFSRELTFVLLAFATTSVLACGGSVEPKTADDASSGDSTASQPTSDVDSIDNTARVSIDDSILKACGIDRNDADFDFDSARVKEAHTGVLKQVATCFSSGPLKGKTLSVVGFTDPRGDEAYNDGLSQRRAGNVSKFIGNAGLSAQKMRVTGLGEAEAKSSEDGAEDRSSCEAAWAADRRVDLKLADP